MNISKKYFIASKIFELIGFLCFIWCWIIYWPTIVMFLDGLLYNGRGGAIDLWTGSHLGMALLGWLVSAVMILKLTFTLIPPVFGIILGYISIFLVGILLTFILIAGSTRIFQSWINWNKEKLK